MNDSPNAWFAHEDFLSQVITLAQNTCG
jgi:hypothetical protein